jgi:hypothetical protein
MTTNQEINVERYWEITASARALDAMAKQDKTTITPQVREEYGSICSEVDEMSALIGAGTKTGNDTLDSLIWSGHFLERSEFDDCDNIANVRHSSAWNLGIVAFRGILFAKNNRGSYFSQNVKSVPVRSFLGLRFENARLNGSEYFERACGFANNTPEHSLPEAEGCLGIPLGDSYNRAKSSTFVALPTNLEVAYSDHQAQIAEGSLPGYFPRYKTAITVGRSNVENAIGMLLTEVPSIEQNVHLLEYLTS